MFGKDPDPLHLIDYIAHDPADESIVVAHEGTDSKNM
jgi:hypothetical protein